LNALTMSAHPSVRPSVPFFFAIFQPTIFKFWILFIYEKYGWVFGFKAQKLWD
jgi:hypothetical protein